MFSTLSYLAAILGLAVLIASPATAQTPDLSGVYHNRFSGGFSGSEWFQVTSLDDQPNRYHFADIHGGGFFATVSGDEILIDGGRGSGRRTGVDSFVLMPVLGGTAFVFDNVRAPETKADFPLARFVAHPGNSHYAGNWVSRTHARDPRSGTDLGGGEEALTLAVIGNTLRITDPAGLYFQGVFSRAESVTFRVAKATPVRSPEFATISGSDINFEQDMLGYLVFQDANNFTATFLLQSRDPLGHQKQRLIVFEARRASATD